MNAGEPVPVVNVTGEQVVLGPLRRELIPAYQRWNNDFATTRTLAQSPPTTFEQQETSYEQLAKGEHGLFFTVYERATWRVIGLTYLTDVDHRNHSAEFGIVIGERDCRGRGYGTETTRLMLDHGFTVLGLHNIMLTCVEHNLAGRRAYEKARFREIGRRRQCRWMGDRLWDQVSMDCLATNFTGGPRYPMAR